MKYLQNAPPILSGAAVLWFLERVIFSEQTGYRFYVSMGVLVFMFLISALLYYALRRLSKDKDVYLISTIGKMVDDLFVKYGTTGQYKEASVMKEILQEIHRLVERMTNSVSRAYHDK